MYDQLVSVGGVNYSAEEKAFADKIAKTLGQDKADAEKAAGVQAYKEVGTPRGSTDVGEVSFTVTTVGMSAATWVPGTPAHSWQAVATGGTRSGNKGMMVAAKTLALTAEKLFSDPSIIAKANEEFEERRGPDFQYAPLLGDRAPALDYRK